MKARWHISFMMFIPVLVHAAPCDFILENYRNNYQHANAWKITQKIVYYLPGEADQTEKQKIARKYQPEDQTGLPEWIPPPDGLTPEMILSGQKQEKLKEKPENPHYCRVIQDAELFLQYPDRMKIKTKAKPEIAPTECRPQKPMPENQWELLNLGEDAIIIINGQSRPAGKNPEWLFKYLFLKDPDNLLPSRMQQAGIDINSLAVNPCRNKKCFVVGRGIPDENETTSQLWIEQDSFLPVKLVHHLYKTDDGSYKAEAKLEFSQFQEIEGVFYPGKIEFYQEEKPAKAFILKKADLNPKIPESAFVIPSAIPE